jgi:hypothetical protein
MNPLGLVDVPNKERDLVLPLAKGANIDGVSLGTPPMNSCLMAALSLPKKKRIAQHDPHLHEFIPNASHGRPQLHHLHTS